MIMKAACMKAADMLNDPVVTSRVIKDGSLEEKIDHFLQVVMLLRQRGELLGNKLDELTPRAVKAVLSKPLPFRKGILARVYGDSAIKFGGWGCQGSSDKCRTSFRGTHPNARDQGDLLNHGYFEDIIFDVVGGRTAQGYVEVLRELIATKGKGKPDNIQDLIILVWCYNDICLGSWDGGSIELDELDSNKRYWINELIKLIKARPNVIVIGPGREAEWQTVNFDKNAKFITDHLINETDKFFHDFASTFAKMDHIEVWNKEKAKQGEWEIDHLDY